MADAELLALKDGQVYRWRWSDPARDADHGPYRSYHCKSQIAVVRGGKLFDTYWMDNTHQVDPKEVVLTLIADDTWPTILSGEDEYYEAADVADTRHPNASRAPIFLRPGAVRSVEAINAALQHREERAQGDIRTAQWRLANVAEARKLLAEGKINEVRL